MSEQKNVSSLSTSVLVVGLLVIGGVFARNQFNSGNTTIAGNNNNTHVRGGVNNTTNNTTVYGSTDSLMVVPSSSKTVSETVAPESRTKPEDDYALQVTEPPLVVQEPRTIETNNGLIRYRGIESVPAGEKYKLDFAVDYRAATPSKFYANLVPDSRDPNLHHIAHLDNISTAGRALEGDGSMRFSLTGTAPSEPGTYHRSITMGLMDHERWMELPTFVNYQFSFILIVPE